MPKVFNPLTQQWEGEDDNPMASAADLANGPMPAGTQDAYGPEEVHEQGPDTEPDEKPIQNAMGFNPNTAMAQRYKGIVQDYQGKRMAGELPGETYKDPSGQSMNVPQQFGQDGSPVDPNEGPLTPEETAKALPSSPGEMEKRIRQHTLGYRLGPADPKQAARQSGYDTYVETREAADDQRRNAQRERAKVNQENIAQRDSRTMQQMADYNRAIGPGGASSGAGGAGGSGAYAERVGGLTLLRGAGHFRPQSTSEAAESNYHNAQANWMNARPEVAKAMEAGKDARAAGHDATRKTIAQANTEAKAALAKQQAADRLAYTNTVHQNDPSKIAKAKADVKNKIAGIEQILRIKMEQGSMPRGLMRSPDPTYRDAIIDQNTKQPTGEKAPGDFDFYKQALKNELEHMQMLDPHHEHDSDFIKFLEELNQ